MRAWEWGALAVILLLAGFLRLQRPGVVEYRRDEANLSRLALRMARGESVPLLGIGSSVGVPNPPFSVWVFVPPYAVFGNDPVRVTQFVGVLGVLAVLLLFLFARRWFGPGVAVVAAALFAANPWAVIWSRKIWAQDVVPFFVLLTLGVGVLGLVERRRWAQLLFLPLLSVTGQIYYATFVLIPAALYLIWVGRKHLARAFWIGAGLAVLSAVPFAAGVARAWHDLPPGAASAHLEEVGAGRRVALSDDVLLRLRDTWGGSGARAFVGGDVADEVLDGSPDGEPVYEVLGVLALIGCAWVVFRALGRGASPPLRLLALWVVATPLVYAFTWTRVWIHYMIPVLPVGFLALGLVLRDLAAGAWFRVAGRAPWIAVGTALLLALVTAQAWSQTSMLGFVGTHATPGGFGVPLGMRLAARDDILAREPRRVLVYAEGDDVVEDGEAAIWDVLLSGAKDVCVFRYALDVYPREAAIVVNDMDLEDRDLVQHRMRGPSEPAFLVALRPGGRTADAAQTAVDVPAFRGGLRITSFAWNEEGDTLALAWRVDSPQPGEFHVEARLLDGAGREIERIDARLGRAAGWRAGDTLLSRASPSREPPLHVSTTLPLPDPVLDPRAIEVRLYTEVKRPGSVTRRWIGLENDPNSDHVVLEPR